jgi:hypothetical protein
MYLEKKKKEQKIKSERPCQNFSTEFVFLHEASILDDLLFLSTAWY